MCIFEYLCLAFISLSSLYDFKLNIILYTKLDVGHIVLKIFCMSEIVNYIAYKKSETQPKNDEQQTQTHRLTFKSMFVFTIMFILRFMSFEFFRSHLTINHHYWYICSSLSFTTALCAFTIKLTWNFYQFINKLSC